MNVPLGSVFLHIALYFIFESCIKDNLEVGVFFFLFSFALASLCSRLVHNEAFFTDAQRSAAQAGSVVLISTCLAFIQHLNY